MNIIGLGNALVDVLLRLENDQVLHEIGFEKGTMDMISEQQMIAIRSSQQHLQKSQTPGGSACNTMRALANLGVNAGFIGKIGTDEVGEYYEQAVRKAGVTPYFIQTPGISGSCTVLISPDGERSMGTFLGPGPTILPEEIKEADLSNYHCLYIEGYLIVNEALLRGAVQKAKKLGLKVALDLSNFNIVKSFKRLLEDIIPNYVDILFSNESEAEAYTGQQAEDAVKTLSEIVDIAIVTLGKEGAIVRKKAETIRVKAEGGKPIDTTGAGDHFAAGFLYGQSVGGTLEQSARTGSLLAGHVIDVIGPEIPEFQWEQIKLKVREIFV
ncbi:adenosine kinase [Parabacteroides sp. PF5-9]|uniref:adenosine kinase n=1 Tax=Parabacteroides sp. PF5-9 TaxID=1742404 RepID=UPI0024746E7A|nr:adenosine kinase [Parabacteroides sp. PF5-9]MDH6359190.1 sugar/nucleoside kinase (ribokinase family) [Parabacteroides sp. PF5-9]